MNNWSGKVLLRIRVADEESSRRRPVREGDRLLVGLETRAGLPVPLALGVDRLLSDYFEAQAYECRRSFLS